jgi:GT2 family glycosyltransferase
MITTRNRAEALERTCEMIATLNPPPVEVLITADGCTDDTMNVIRRHVPHATVIINKKARGSVACRDVMMRQAKADLVFALDDDSYPEQMNCISLVSSFFEEKPKLAVLHFPQRSDEYPETLSRTEFGPEHLTRSFANSGAVLRRSTYLQLPGFEPRFFHMYEEPDYALQCVAAGYDVIFSPIVIIRHHYSGQARDEIRIHHRHARNELWSTLMRCPFPFALGMVAWRIFSQFRYAWKRGWSWVIREPAWWWQALGGAPHCLRKRGPVSWAGYKNWLSLP